CGSSISFCFSYPRASPSHIYTLSLHDALPIWQEKEGLMRSVNGDMVKVEELQRLLRFTSKGTMLTEFDDAIFLSFVERITVLSRKEVAFELKCGLSLRERLVES